MPQCHGTEWFQQSCTCGRASTVPSHPESTYQVRQLSSLKGHWVRVALPPPKPQGREGPIYDILGHSLLKNRASAPRTPKLTSPDKCPLPGEGMYPPVGQNQQELHCMKYCRSHLSTIGPRLCRLKQIQQSGKDQEIRREHHNTKRTF